LIIATLLVRSGDLRPATQNLTGAARTSGRTPRSLRIPQDRRDLEDGVLFAVTMQIDFPHDLDPEVRADLLTRESAYSRGQQEAGHWPHLWRIAGQYANLSIIDAEDNTQLHDILSNLPLFPYMTIDVKPLTRHPNSING
jgi:muconolactone D-isomerase